MKHKRHGFTLIEVTLFVALTGLLFMGVVIGTGRSIAGQRFFDAAQNYGEFLKSVYSQVSNPQSIGQGQGDIAIYGKMISFGQKYGLDGSELPKDEQHIFVYDVVGNASGDFGGEIVKALKDAKANVAVVTSKNGSTVTEMQAAGIVVDYEPHWGAVIEKTEAGELYEGTVLIVRHPSSGTINTIVSPEVINVNEIIYNEKNWNKGEKLLSDVLAYTEMRTTNPDLYQKRFVAETVDFCVNPEGINAAGTRGMPADARWDIRILKNARNASGVEVIDLDDITLGADDVLNRCRVSNWQAIEGS